MSYSEKERRNLQCVSAMYEAVLKPLDSSQVDRFISPDYIQHSSILAESGREALKPMLDALKEQSPEAETHIKRMFADDDHVIAHTHVKRFKDDNGLAVVDIFRLEAGMIAEHWDVIQEIDTGVRSAESMF